MKPKTREQNFLAKIAGDANADTTMKPRTAEEYFLNQIAENGSSSLPSYSSSDIGKVLTVGEGSETVQTVIVPEQTVTKSDGSPVPLTDAVVSGFVKGNAGVMVVNGESYNVTATGDGMAIVFGNADSQMIGLFNGNVLFSARDTGTYTVSLTVSTPKLQLKWSFNQGGGGDFSTASVTIVNATTKNLTVGEFPPYVEHEEYISYGGEISVASNSSVSFTAVLYKGFAGLQLNEGMTFTTSDSVEIDEYNYASISGDCTITITAAA